MIVTAMRIPEVLRIEPKVFGDPRGYFMESYHAARYAEFGIPAAFVQDNVSASGRGILRGLHLQNPHPQGKLVYVLEGEVFDVAVDVRVGSPTFGQWVGEYLSAANHRQLWVPEGFAHGFCVTSERALFCYKCTDRYHPEAELSVRWDDPALGIDWPVREPRVSDKDAQAACLHAIDPAKLPGYEGTAT
ncbi:dTDP-4-dehydrorhamnose 3,5-epimerase [Thioalkalivibrio nitratireducens DSM 14787]|uniref:dTDP-4-dehydrorhamnose 3,5-epimerase n=1 Tax=Thioalkalivibrio nitratireducens (strain DSM 14787 / UNIQEM 213 / ALEN2) TaxID=1255043 RepID=L0DX97_THIND|nr:dTDP-4-dehydrorhamnose 3,5-epimerase [Thioalkalivibrio nitratireducens]AGA33590.1 dTDP-4-dehydrorhamnose 3,5-epimerase [Thioalkalivibrio nitratireducens DSM 14787]